MPKIEVPDGFVRKIMMENGLNPDAFCLILHDETTIVLRNYKTRDDITIHQGDKQWSRRT